MLFFGFVHAPAQTDVKPALHRVFHRRQTDRYEVEVDSEGSGGSAHLEYEVKMVAERPVDKSTDTKVEVTFINLRARYNDIEAPEKKLFGAASYQFPTTGFPADYSLGGENSSVVLPILSWYMPTEAVTVGSDFKVDPMRFDGAFSVFGTGTLVSQDDKTAKIKLDLAIASGNSSAAGSASSMPHFNSVAVFDLKTGVLESAEGGLKGGSGSMTFKLKKI